MLDDPDVDALPGVVGCGNRASTFGASRSITTALLCLVGLDDRAFGVADDIMMVDGDDDGDVDDDGRGRGRSQEHRWRTCCFAPVGLL